MPDPNITYASPFKSGFTVGDEEQFIIRGENLRNVNADGISIKGYNQFGGEIWYAAEIDILFANSTRIVVSFVVAAAINNEVQAAAAREKSKSIKATVFTDTEEVEVTVTNGSGGSGGTTYP